MRSLSRDSQAVRAFECSVLDCYGLKTLYNYFNVPFLELRVADLKRLYNRTKAELATAKEEVACYIDEQEYDEYLKWVGSSKCVHNVVCCRTCAGVSLRCC